MGIEEVPNAGDSAVVVENEKDARTLAEHRAELVRIASQSTHQKFTLEDLLSRGGNAEARRTLNLVIKADVNGSLEALKGAFEKLTVDGTDLKVLHAGVGAVTESDVMLAHTDGAVIIAFNVRPDAKAREAMDSHGVEVRTYKIIYEALEDVEKALKGLLAPTIKEKVQGSAEIRQTFTLGKVGTIAGCFVIDGKIGRHHHVRLLRDSKIVWEGRLASLRRFKDDVREVEKGYECGMNLDGFNDIKVGDVIETFTREAVPA
jgi:translation initiation factor IF-2